jgi:2'-5' RNA ligase
MRAFIAIDLDPEIKKNLLDILRRLKRLAPHNIGWVKEQGLHLTLKFLGEIDEAQTAQIKDLMKAIAGTTKPFSLEMKGTGFFPPESRHPRVLWIGTREQPVLAELQERFESGLEKIGISREARPFHPHLTLGRIKGPFALAEIVAELKKQEAAAFGEMIVDKVTLFKSVLRPTGAEYSILEESLFS